VNIVNTEKPSENVTGPYSPFANRYSRDHRLQAVVFDMDGVLLDSEPLHHVVLNEVLATEGKHLSFDEYRPYIGTTLEYTWSDIIRRLDLRGPIDRYIQAYDDGILESYRQHSVIAPGVRALLDLLAARGLPLAVASSSRTDWVETALTTLGIREDFRLVVTGDMVTQSKPDPGIYLLAAGRLGIDPAHCLAVEDSPKGVQAASAAGMTVVGVRTAYTAHLQLDGAIVVLDSLDQFDAALLERLTAASSSPPQATRLIGRAKRSG
jgi:HAD superfamily hydrolase (TIGR01509 family)